MKHMYVFLFFHVCRGYVPDANASAVLSSRIMWWPARLVLFPKKLILIHSFLKIMAAVS